MRLSRMERALRLSIKVYFHHRRVCICEAFPLEGEGGFSGAGRKRTRMRVYFHRTLLVNRSFALRSYPLIRRLRRHLPPRWGRLMLFTKSFYSHTRFRFFYSLKRRLIAYALIYFFSFVLCLSGKRTVMVVPFPALLLTLMVASCKRAACLTIERPRPVSPVWRLWLLSTR